MVVERCRARFVGVSLDVMAEDSKKSPIEPRPAATIMLVRDAANSGIEVLMVKRNLNSDFVGGAYVFPGGGVDASDGGPVAEARCRGLSDAEASSILGVDRGGLAYWVAVLRELFEEAGILVATKSDGAALELTGATAQRFVAHRAAVNDKSRRFLDVIDEEQLTLDVGDLYYFAHWITPEGAPRRYDTRFFVARAPERQTAAHDAGEVVADEWIAPADALRRHREGDIELIFPTIRNLQALDRFDNVDALLTAARTASSVPAILPRITVSDRGVRILLPGDPGYDEAFQDGEPPEPKGNFNDAVRQISATANPEPEEPTS
jgi:8-oxo-dGTP pyrophosphatase MutT (NUDIX family)